MGKIYIQVYKHVPIANGTFGIILVLRPYNTYIFHMFLSKNKQASIIIGLRSIIRTVCIFQQAFNFNTVSIVSDKSRKLSSELVSSAEWNSYTVTCWRISRRLNISMFYFCVFTIWPLDNLTQVSEKPSLFVKPRVTSVL